MGKHTSNYSVTPECVVIGLKQISKIFGFKELGENTYLRKVEGEEDICLVYANDFLTFFTDDTNITYLYEEICDGIKMGLYNERTFFNKVLELFKEA